MRRLVILLAACGHTAAPTHAPSNPGPPAKRAMFPEKVIASHAAAVAIAQVGDQVYWLDSDGSLHRASAAGGDDATIALPGDAGDRAMIADRGAVLGASGSLWILDPGAAQPRVLADDVGARSVAASGETVYYGDGNQILTIPRAGGTPKVIVSAGDAGTPGTLVADDHYLYWADAGDPRKNDGAIRRVPLAGGKVEVLAQVRQPIDLARVGDRLFWTSNDAAIASMPAAGGAVTVLLHGSGGRIAADRDGVVVITDAGLVVDQPIDGGVARVRAVDLPGAPIAIDADGVTLGDSNGSRVVRTPRGDAAMTVIASTAAPIQAIAADGDRIDLLERGAKARVWSVPAKGGAPTLVATPAGDAYLLAADHGHLAVVDSGDKVTVLGGPSRDVEFTPSALAIDGGNVDWLAGDKLITAPLGAGDARVIFANPGHGVGYGCGQGGSSGVDENQAPNVCLPPTGHVVRAGDRLLFGGGLLDRVIALDGDKPTVVVDGGVEDFAVAGDQVAAWTDARGLALYPSGKVLISQPSIQAGIARAADATGVWLEDDDGDASLVHVPLAGGQPDLSIALPPGVVTVIDGALCFTTAGGNLLLRLAS